MIKSASQNRSVSQLHSFKVTFSLFTKFWLKSFFGPFFAFGFSFLIYAILGAIMGYSIVFPGILAMVTMSQGITGMPFAILELKNSVLLKRIGASPVKTYTFTLVIVAFFMIVSILIWIYMSFWAYIFTTDNGVFDNLFRSASTFFNFFYGFLLNSFLSISLGFAIASISKGPNQAQAIGMLIYFPSSFLSGQFLSPAIIAGSPTMEWISRFIPFRYTTMYMQEGWYDGNPFDFTGAFQLPSLPSLPLNKWLEIQNVIDSNPSEVANIIRPYAGNLFINIFDKYDHIVGSVYPHIMILATLGVSIKKFRWSVRR